MAGKNIVVQAVPGTYIEGKRVEIVERKGVGHPDSLADGIADSISRALCERYREVFGAILHHNTDEVQIIGGRSEPGFNGGSVIQPFYILLGGRATQAFEGESINVHGVAMRTAKLYLHDNLRHLDIDEDVILDSRIGEGSTDLTEMYERGDGVPLANDTSFGIGHAPFSETEQVVLTVENLLNSAGIKEKHPFIGEDVKVMAYRDGDTINLTVAVAFIDRYVSGVEDYYDKKAVVEEIIVEAAEEVAEREVKVSLNTADGDTEGSLYLTVTGTSAEMGDDGSVGRGNRVNGLITPHRSMSLEASSGKNPVSHIGKIYNLLAHRVAQQVVETVSGVEEADVKLLSQIGHPINDPQIASVDVAAEDIGSAEREEIREAVASQLDDADELLDDIVAGNASTF